MLQNDFDNGARVLATKAVEALKDIITAEGKTAQTAKQLWDVSRVAGWKLKNARPSMGAAIGSAVTQALQSVKVGWEKEFGSEWMNVVDLELVLKIASKQAQITIEERNGSVKHLANNFVMWLSKKRATITEDRPLRLLTLSSSSSLKACLIKAFLEVPNTRFDLRIIESRPRCEGATFCAALLKELHGIPGIHDRLYVQLASDSSIAMLSRDVDVVLLGADRISGDGDVSNKIGSLAAAACAKAFSPYVEVVVVSESDKIAKPGAMEEHAEEDNDPQELIDVWDPGVKSDQNFLKYCKIRNVYFEWVPNYWLDAYICEKGILSKMDVMEISRQTEAMEKDIFGSLPEIDLR